MLYWCVIHSHCPHCKSVPDRESDYVVDGRNSAAVCSVAAALCCLLLIIVLAQSFLIALTATSALPFLTAFSQLRGSV